MMFVERARVGIVLATDLQFHVDQRVADLAVNEQNEVANP